MQHLWGLFWHLYLKVKQATMKDYDFFDFNKTLLLPFPKESGLNRSLLEKGAARLASSQMLGLFFAKYWWQAIRYCAFSLIALFLTNCANPIAPTGGPKDERPPQLDTLHSTRNKQVRFEKQDIVLAFDEWVELKDAFNQVVISPPLEFRPTIKRKKKTIQLVFDDREVLRDSATYVINFGDAIRDMTEGNIAPIIFVFSTGDYIDSLSVNGRIIDAYTLQPVKDVLFMLYENLADSVFRTERPFYFSKTDEKGIFKVNNIKAGAFKAVALLDKNLNYRFDGEAELIAFLDTALIIKGVEKIEMDSLAIPINSLQNDSIFIDSLAFDSTDIDSMPPNRQLTIDLPDGQAGNQQSITLKLFEEEKSLYLRDDDTKTYGKVKLAFNREPYDAIISYDSIGQYTFLEQEKDTSFLWYSMEADAAFNIYVKRDTSIDTVEVANGLREKFYEKAKLEVAEKAPTRLPVLSLSGSFSLTFKHPLYSFDERLIHLLEDSIKTEVAGQFKIDSLQNKKLSVKAEWKEGMRYEEVLPPGSITDMFGLQNVDTIRRSWKMGLEKEYGSLTLRVKDLLPDTAYVIRLLAKNDAVVDTFHVKDTALFETKFHFLLPDTYSVEVIEDLDRNGRWTTGNYGLKRQPERVQKATLEEVRANWEVDAEVGVKFDSPAISSPAAPQFGRQ